MKDNVIQVLNELSHKINNLYGYIEEEGDNFGEPSINSGPCGPFANAFYDSWNKRFKKKVSIVFVIVKNSEECWHVLIRLPNGLLFDGGYGVHNERKWTEAYDIEEMKDYNLDLLNERSYGLEREYPRYCPNFSLSMVTSLIENYLQRINEDDI